MQPPLYYRDARYAPRLNLMLSLFTFCTLACRLGECSRMMNPCQWVNCWLLESKVKRFVWRFRALNLSLYHFRFSLVFVDTLHSSLVNTLNVVSEEERSSGIAAWWPIHHSTHFPLRRMRGRMRCAIVGVGFAFTPSIWRI